MASGPIGDEPKQGAGPSDDNIGALIVLALLFFAVFFFLGFYNERKEHSKPEYIKNFVISRTRLEHSGDTNRLVYGPSNRAVLWTLDLKNNSVRLGDSMDQLAMLESTKPKIIPVDRSLFWGGAVLTVNDLVKIVTKGGGYQKIIVNIVGAGTGYSAGCFISGHLFPPRYNDRAIMNWLKSSDFSEFKKSFLIKEIAKKSAQQTIDGDSDEKLRAYKLLEDRLRDPTYVPSNEDFSVFAEVR